MLVQSKPYERYFRILLIFKDYDLILHARSNHKIY